MNGLQGIAGGSALVLLGLVALVAVVAWVLTPHHRQRHIWRFTLPSVAEPKIILESIRGEATGIYHRPSTGFGAVVAVAQLTNAINASRRGWALRTTASLRQPVEICFSEDERADRWCGRHHTVLVGGPKHNRITESVLMAFGLQLPPDRHQRPGGEPSDDAPPVPEELSEEEAATRQMALQFQADILKRRTAACLRSPGVASSLGVATQGNSIYWFGDAYLGDVTDRRAQTGGRSGYDGLDYGVVLRLPSTHLPDGTDRRMVVVFGSQTYGVGIAAAWLVNVCSRTTDRRARTLMRTNRNIAVLVKARVENGVAGEPELIDIVTLPEHLQPREQATAADQAAPEVTGR